MNIEQKAATAARLLADEGFLMAFDEIKSAAVAVFLDAASTPEAREEAHESVRSIEQLKARFASWSDDLKRRKHKERSAP